MPKPLQNILALIYDFDHTLSPGCMQEPLFRKYGVSGEQFWKENSKLMERAHREGVHLDQELAYLNLILCYVKQGKFRFLSNFELHELGQEIDFYLGIPGYFPALNERMQENNKYKKHGIKLEHYVISTGLKEMILGSAIGPYFTDIFAAEYLEDQFRVIRYIARAVGFIKKTEYIHLINKGANINHNIDLNGVLAKEERRIPFENMTYIGDGFTDIPCFATLNHRGGTSLGVYDPNSRSAKKQAERLLEQQRVLAIHPADYREGSSLFEGMLKLLEERADRIVDRLKEKRR